MAILRNANPRNTSGGFERLLGNPELGTLISKVHSSVISSGNELERMIADLVPNVSNLDQFLEIDNLPQGVLLAHKRQIKNSQTLDITGGEPDFLIFRRYGDSQACHVIELKDGHVFDTKKATAEWNAIHDFIERNSENINYNIRAHFCAFNQNNRVEIREGFKKRISIDEALTGREFCDLLNIEYDAIIHARRAHQVDNFEFFISELVRVEAVRIRLHELLNG